MDIPSQNARYVPVFKEHDAGHSARSLQILSVRRFIQSSPAAWRHTGPRDVVGLGGLEPPASPLSGVRSNHLSYRPNVSPSQEPATVGGACRDRTDDPLLAKQVLSQLS